VADGTDTGVCWKGETTFLQLLKTEGTDGTWVVLVVGAQ